MLTHIAVASIPTSNPAKYSIVVLRWRFGAQTRLRFSTIIMGDSRSTRSRNQCRILHLKPNYAGSPEFSAQLLRYEPWAAAPGSTISTIVAAVFAYGGVAGPCVMSAKRNNYQIGEEGRVFSQNKRPG